MRTFVDPVKQLDNEEKHLNTFSTFVHCSDHSLSSLPQCWRKRLLVVFTKHVGTYRYQHTGNRTSNELNWGIGLSNRERTAVITSYFELSFDAPIIFSNLYITELLKFVTFPQWLSGIFPDFSGIFPVLRAK